MVNGLVRLCKDDRKEIQKLVLQLEFGTPLVHFLVYPVFIFNTPRNHFAIHLNESSFPPFYLVQYMAYDMHLYKKIDPDLEQPRRAPAGRSYELVGHVEFG